MAQVLLVNDEYEYPIEDLLWLIYHKEDRIPLDYKIVTSIGEAVAELTAGDYRIVLTTEFAPEPWGKHVFDFFAEFAVFDLLRFCDRHRPDISVCVTCGSSTISPEIARIYRHYRCVQGVFWRPTDRQLQTLRRRIEKALSRKRSALPHRKTPMISLELTQGYAPFLVVDEELHRILFYLNLLEMEGDYSSSRFLILDDIDAAITVLGRSDIRLVMASEYLSDPPEDIRSGKAALPGRIARLLEFASDNCPRTRVCIVSSFPISHDREHFYKTYRCVAVVIGTGASLARHRKAAKLVEDALRIDS